MSSEVPKVVNPGLVHLRISRLRDGIKSPVIERAGVLVRQPGWMVAHMVGQCVSSALSLCFHTFPREHDVDSFVVGMGGDDVHLGQCWVRVGCDSDDVKGSELFLLSDEQATDVLMIADRALRLAGYRPSEVGVTQ